MKEYVKPTITEIIDGLECVDLKSGDNKNKLSYSLFWKGHDSGTYSIIGLCLRTSAKTEKVSGMLYYKGPGKVEIDATNPSDGRTHNAVVEKVWENYFRFSATINVNNANENVEVGLGAFKFYDELSNPKNARGDNEHFGAYQYIGNGEGETGGNVEAYAGSSANQVFLVALD